MQYIHGFLTSKRICAIPLLLLMAMTAHTPCHSQSEIPPSDFTDAMTVAVLKVDTKRASFESLPSALRDFSPAATERVQQFLKSTSGAPVALVASVPDSPDLVQSEFRNRARGSSILRLIVPKAVAGGELKNHSFLKGLKAEDLNSSLVAFTSRTRIVRYAQSESDRGAWNSCQACLADAPIQLMVVPPEHFRKAMTELLPTFPDSVGGGATSTLFDGLLWLAIGLNPTEGDLHITIQSSSNESAKALADSLPKLVESLAAHAEPQASVAKGFVQLLETTQPNISNSQIHFRWKLAESKQIEQLLVASLKTVFGPISNSQKLNKFKHIMLAVHNFIDAYKFFPPLKSHRNQDGTSKLSWRVHLLPYLGEVELYQKFRLDEPWDSPRNRPLLEQMPDCYRMTGYQELTSELPAGYTTIVAPSGPDTLLGSKDVVAFEKVTDGSSNTVALVEVKSDKAVPWTSPLDYEYDPKNPLAGILVDADGRFVIGMGDGSARRLESNLPITTYDYLFRKSDGQVIVW